MDNAELNILVLDGGGSKGVYTLGVLKELELKLGSPLCEHFGLIFGTSTGSIIAALIASTSPPGANNSMSEFIFKTYFIQL